MDDSRSRGGSGSGAVGDSPDDAVLILRRDMVLEQLARRGIRDPRELCIEATRSLGVKGDCDQ